MKHFSIIMQTVQSRQSACHHFLSDQLYNWKTRVFQCCQFRPVGLFLIQTEHMRKPKHSWQDSSLQCLILTAQNKTPWACPQNIPAALATKTPFCHLWSMQPAVSHYTKTFLRGWSTYFDNLKSKIHSNPPKKLSFSELMDPPKQQKQ